MMKIKKKVITMLAVSAVVILGLFVSCSDNIMNDAVIASNTLVWATFGNGHSRGDVAESTYTQTFELKDESEIYWTYTATKTAGDKGGKTGVTTTETPVQSNFGKGLNGAIGPFSQGKWDFNVCGYVGTPSSSQPQGSKDKDYFEVVGKDGSGNPETMYYTKKIYYGSVSGVVLSTGTEKNPDPINVIINIVTEGKGTFAITNTSTFRWQKDNGENPENMYMKIERKTENGTEAEPEYIALTATQVSGSSENYYYTLPEAATSTWDAGYWTVNCSVVQATNTDDSYTDIYTYAKSPDLLIKIYAGQTTNLEARVIEGILAYGEIYIKVVDGVATTTVTKEVVIGTDTILSSSLTPASAASNVTKIDTSRATRVTVPSTVQEFQASKDIAQGSSETVTASLTVTATPVEAANKNFVVSSSSGVAVNAIDLKASVKRTVTDSTGASKSTETQVDKFTSDGTTAVPVIVDTYVASGQENVVINYTYTSDGELKDKTEIWVADALPSDYSEDKANSELTIPDATTGTKGKCYYDDSTGRLIFRTTHFSTFVVGAKVEAVNRTTGKVYSTLGAAVEAATAGETLALLDNVTLASDVTVSKKLTLDMNFYKISGEKEVELDSNVVLTVKNSSADQTSDFIDAEVGGDSSSGADGRYYKTLADAADAADVSTIILLRDISVSDTITLKKSLEIDLNGKTATFADGENLVIEPDAAINVAIKNGSIDGGNGDCSVIKMGSYVDLTLDAVTMTANKVGNKNALVLLDGNSGNNKLTVLNKSCLVMTGYCGIKTDDSVTADVEITVDDSSVTATGNNGESIGLAVTVPAKVTIENNSTISGEKVGVLLKSRTTEIRDAGTQTATIKDSSIKSTGIGTYMKYRETTDYWGEGANVPAAAIVVGNKLSDGYYSLETTVKFDGTVNLSHASSDAVDICIHKQNTKKSIKINNVNYNWVFNDDFGFATVKTTNNYACVENENSLNNTTGKKILVNDIVLTKQCVVASGKDITLDLAGKKVTNDSSFDCRDGMFSVNLNGKLTIEDSIGNGSVESTANESGLGACFKMLPSKSSFPTLTINGGTFRSPTYVIVANGSKENWGTIKNCTKVYINGGTFEVSNGPVIYQPQYGLLKISGGTLKGSDSAVEVRAGSVTITGGEFFSTADEYECKSDTSGTTTKGAAIAVAQHTTNLPITVTVGGGKFSGDCALSVEDPENNASKESWSGVTVKVTGGTFKSTSSGTPAIKVGEVFALTTTGDKATAYRESSEFTVESGDSFTVSKNVTQ